MALPNLKENIQEEREIVREIFVFLSHMPNSNEKEKEMMKKTISSLLQILNMINNSIPSLLDNISPIKKLSSKPDEAKGLVSMVYKKAGVNKAITINESDKRKFTEELRLVDFSVKKMKRDFEEKGVVFKEFKKSSVYAKLSNRFFSRLSDNLVEKEYFNDLNTNLRKANMPFIVNTYVSMIFFTTLLSAIFSVFLFILLLFFKISIDFPFFIPAELTSERLLINIAIGIIIPILTFTALYGFPYTEKKSVGKKVEQELPFVVIHMSAIAGSGIEPSNIFKIIALGREYPYMRQEIRKVMNQVNFFGYDLVSALKNSAKTAPSTKLAELFNGLATAISSGGSLTEFLDKRAESLLFDYKLEREKSTKTAESFMDIYISVVIAAPMILMLLMILMSVNIISIGLGIQAITVIILSVVALINVIFLVFLHIRQPMY